MKPIIYEENNCVYLVQDLGNLNLYERSKLINKFVKNDTKVLEDYIDRQIKAIFVRYGINAYSSDKSVLEKAIDSLNAKGIKIDIIDLYEKPLYKCEKVGISPNYMNIQLEDNRYLQCGMEIKEIKI